MLATILGIILITIPFFLVFCFKNRLQGFLYILGGSFGVHLFIAFFTQFFHIFVYLNIVCIYLLIDIFVLFFIKKNFNEISFKINLNWLAIFGFLIILFELWSVHFYYTGKISTVTGPQEVVKNSYPYPYFSDEWVGASLSDYSMKHNTLPVVNSLATDRKNNNFPNIFICFFSLISELFLILQISPLLGYALFSIVAGFLICFLIFSLLRLSGVGLFISLITAMSIPFIANSANLPGIWYLLPFIGGLILFLLSLIGFAINNITFAELMAALSVLLYPPIIIFIGPVYLTHLFLEKKINKYKKIEKIIISLLIAASVTLAIIFSQMSRVNELLAIALSSIWRLNLDGGIVTYYLWQVIPVIILPFSLIGLIKLIKQKKFILLTPVFIAVFFWIFYSFSIHYFIIDYARVVVIAAIFLVMCSGFGFSEVFNQIIKKYDFFASKKNKLVVKVIILLMFFSLSFFYTNNSAWQTMTLQLSDSSLKLTPAAPANAYLQADDLDLFKQISNARFLSPPWKGLVLGVATSNHPLNTKDSIVSTNFMYYNDFMARTCEEKVADAKKAHLLYVYSREFSCDNFNFLGKSHEDLYLYKFKP